MKAMACLALLMALASALSPVAYAEENVRDAVPQPPTGEPAAPVEEVKAAEPKTYEDIFGKPSRFVPAGVPLLAQPVPGFDIERLADYSNAELIQQSEFHWAYYETEPTGRIVDELLKRDPDNAEHMWRKARYHYDHGEGLPEDDHDARMKNYTDMVALMERCVELHPQDDGCLFFIGVAYGRLATTKGLLSSLMKASVVEENWLKVLDMPRTYTNSRGESMQFWARFGLAIFHRMVPDWWILKLIAGTRGDKKKSIEYFRECVKEVPNRMDVRKEMGVVLICYGALEDDEAALKEGREIIEGVAAGKWRDYRNTDEIDMRHAAEILKKDPEEVCGYSRDGYEKVDRASYKQ